MTSRSQTATAAFSSSFSSSSASSSSMNETTPLFGNVAASPSSPPPQPQQPQPQHPRHPFGVVTLSFEQRARLLQRAFPKEFVDAYCGGSRIGSAVANYPIPHEELILALQHAPHLVVDETPYQRYLNMLLCSSSSSTTTTTSSSSSTGGGCASAADHGGAGGGGDGGGGAEHPRGAEPAATAPLTTAPTTTFFLPGDQNAKHHLSRLDPKIIESAARRIATYWRMRVETFQERAFLPMIQTPPPLSTEPIPAPTATAATGPNKNKNNKTKKTDNTATTMITVEGALPYEDQEVLMSGIMTMLPPTADPLQRRSVSCHNDIPELTRISKDPSNTQSIIRVSFYLMYLQSLNPASQVYGTAFLGLTASTGVMPKETYERIIPYLKTALPVKQTEMHYLCLPSTLTFLRNVTVQLGVFLHACYERILRIPSLHGMQASPLCRTHFGFTDDQVVSKLIQCTGFRRQDIPTWMGGTMELETFRKFLARQRSTEQNARLTPEQREHNRRVENALNSRKKRSRANAQLDHLQRDAQELQAQNRQLQNEHQHLHYLLRAAQERIHQEKNHRPHNQQQDLQHGVFQGYNNDTSEGGGGGSGEGSSSFSSVVEDPSTVVVAAAGGGGGGGGATATYCWSSSVVQPSPPSFDDRNNNDNDKKKIKKQKEHTMSVASIVAAAAVASARAGAAGVPADNESAASASSSSTDAVSTSHDSSSIRPAAAVCNSKISDSNDQEITYEDMESLYIPLVPECNLTRGKCI